MSGQKFRKKPVVIEAMQFTKAMTVTERVALLKWLTTEMAIFADCIVIHTLEGAMRCDFDDWIIKGVKGEFYPCKPDVFALTYEPTAAPREAGEREAAVLALGEAVLRFAKNPTSVEDEDGRYKAVVLLLTQPELVAALAAAEGT